MMADDLLPANKTPLETALSVTMRDGVFNEELGIRGLKYEPKSVLFQWLVWEYGLEELRPYVSDEVLLKEGVEFQRIRGTTEAIRRAIGWLGYNDIVIEQEIIGRHSAEIQIDPGSVLTVDEARRIAEVFELAKPARARLSRIFHDYDLRRFKLNRRPIAGYGPEETLPASLKDGSVLSGGDLLSADSGVQVWPGGPLLSFARTTKVRYEYIDGPTIGANFDRLTMTRVKSGVIFTLDVHGLSDLVCRIENRWGAIHAQRFVDGDAKPYGLWMEASWETVDQPWNTVQIVTRGPVVIREAATTWDNGTTTWDAGATEWVDRIIVTTWDDASTTWDGGGTSWQEETL